MTAASPRVRMYDRAGVHATRVSDAADRRLWSVCSRVVQSRDELLPAADAVTCDACKESDPDTCRHCGVNFAYEAYGKTYSRAEMHEIPGVHDGVLFYQCPDCGGRWHHLPADSHLFGAAESYVNGTVRE